MSRFDRMLATILSKRNLIGDEQREMLVAECERLGQPLPSVLLRKRICREPALIAAVASELSCHPILLEHVTPSAEALQILTGDQCLKNEVLPLSRLGNTITMAVSNPFDEPRLDKIRAVTGCEVIPVLTTTPSLRRKLRNCYPGLPIEADEVPEEEGVAGAQGKAQSSWLNLAAELEQEARAVAPSPQVELPVRQDGAGTEETRLDMGAAAVTEPALSETPALQQESPAQVQPPPQPEAQVDLQPDLPSAQTEQLIQEDVVIRDETPDTERPSAPCETAPEGQASIGGEVGGGAEVQVEAPPSGTAPEVQVPVEGEVRVEAEIQVEAPPPSGTAPEVQVPVESEVRVEAETQVEAPPSQSGSLAESCLRPFVPAVESAERALPGERSWESIVAAAPARAAMVSWWRAAEAGVPSANEDLQGEDAQALMVVRALLQEAFEQDVEELVFESAEDGLRILERTARVLRTMTVAPRHLHALILDRLKWMAGLPGGERRAWTGSFLAAERGREFVCRLHVLPTIWGERLQLEFTASAVFSGGLDALGITSPGSDDYRWAISNPAGLLLLAAPPGHGREPTLRALLGLSRPNGEQAVTLENPVLVRMPGITQVAVGRSVGLSTADALRTALRRAPDRLMISDIRDAETARLAIQAAASGSLVLAGMDAPDVFCALARLADSGLPPFTLASALRLAASQRSLRRLCGKCRESIPVDRERMALAGCREQDWAGATMFRAVGCGECRHGYRGRIPVFETLRIAGDLSRMVRSGTPVGEWRNKTLEWGFLTLRRMALRLALQGQTSLDEVLVGTPEDV